MSRQDTSDIVFRRILAVFPISILILVAGIFLQLVWSSHLSLQKFGIGFLFSSVWDPVAEEFRRPAVYFTAPLLHPWLLFCWLFPSVWVLLFIWLNTRRPMCPRLYPYWLTFWLRFRVSSMGFGVYLSWYPACAAASSRF